MADKITLNNTVFEIPDVGDQNYGEELNRYLIELANTINGISGTFDIPTSEVALTPTPSFQNIEGLLFPSNDVVSGEVEFTLIRTMTLNADPLQEFRFVERGVMSFFQGQVPDNTNVDGFQLQIESSTNIDRQIIEPNLLSVTIDVTVEQEGGGGFDEQQRVEISATPNTGTYTLEFDSEDAVINFSDNTTQIQTKLNALTTIDSVTVTGNAQNYLITFGGTQANTNVSTIIAKDNSLVEFEYIDIGESGLDLQFSGSQLQYSLKNIDTNVYTDTEAKFIFRASTTPEE